MNKRITFLIAIISVFSCQPAEESTQEKAVKQRFDPYKSEFYERIVILPENTINKDTFQVGDTLVGIFGLSKEVEMLKEIARKERLTYELEFKYDSNGTRVLTNPNKLEKAVSTFIVRNDTLETGEVAQQYYETRVKFGFRSPDYHNYDTTFVRGNYYYVIKD